MKIGKQKLIYFVLLAPVLTKILEWLLQWASIGWSHLAHGVWIMQLLFIVTLASLIYGLMYLFKEDVTIENFMLIPALAYFLKEVYNALFVYQSFGFGIIFALTVEPLLMYYIFSWLPYDLYFRKKMKGRKR